jgi:hypothetical protein
LIHARIATYNRRTNRETQRSPTGKRKTRWRAGRSWYVPGALGEKAQHPCRTPARRLLIGVAALASLLGLSACGGGARQDATEPDAKFPVEIVTAQFPNRQRLADTSDFRLAVKNTGQQMIPDLAVTIFVDDGADGPFSIRLKQPGLANPNRPVWILENNYPKLAGESAPAGANAAQTNTFAFGPLQPQQSVDAIWRVTPVRPGTYTLNYVLAAGLNGKAKAVTADGSLPKGQFVVTIGAKPPPTCVNDAGQVVAASPSACGA